ncbi:MAG: endo-1,4-beta-xylanase [Planctomycetota bacterium]
MSRLLGVCPLIGVLCSLPAAVHADPATVLDALPSGAVPVPVRGTPSLTGQAAADAALHVLGPDDTTYGPGFGLVTEKQPGRHYNIEARVPLAGAVAKGDTLFARFWARAKAGARYETGEGYTLFRVQETEPPYVRGLYREWVVGPEWREYYVAERFNHDLPDGYVMAAFSGGYPPQHIEVAGLEVFNFGPGVDPASLPAMDTSYPGAEPDAEWRKRAQQRIEQHRMGDLAVEVVDGEGRPVPGAEVRVEMTRHAFEFGAAIGAVWLNENWDTPAAATYRRLVLEHFNTVAIENALKWSWWERDPEVSLRTLRWAKDHRLRVHGHVLVWPGLEKFRTEDAEAVWAAAQDDPQVLRDRVNGHIRSILEGTAGLVDVWDVVNEAYNQNEFIKLLGEGEIAEWFKLAEQYAPDAKLMYNDFALLGSSGTNRVKHRFVIDLVDGVRHRGGRVDAIGLQSHLGNGYTPPPRVLDIIDQFAAAGNRLKITEYDLAVTPDPELAERYTRDFLTAIFSHPEVVGFTAWNFASAVPTWMPEAAYFGDDWEPLPVGRAYLDLVKGDWWTDETVSTDAAGRARVRGFLGEHRVTVTVGGATYGRDVDLPAAGATLRVVAE